MNELQIGNIVRLKSGGPKMTVENFKWDPFNKKYDYNQVLCTWFVNDKRQKISFLKNHLLRTNKKLKNNQVFNQ